MAEVEKWVTINGKHVPIMKDGTLGVSKKKKIDENKVFEIAERYNTSIPVSGDWNTELDHEIATIQKELGLSKSEAKDVMKEYLGFQDTDFVDDEDIRPEASRSTPKSERSTVGNKTSSKSTSKSTKTTKTSSKPVKTTKTTTPKTSENKGIKSVLGNDKEMGIWKLNMFDRTSLREVALEVGMKSSDINRLSTVELRTKLMSMYTK